MGLDRIRPHAKDCNAINGGRCNKNLVSHHAAPKLLSRIESKSDENGTADQKKDSKQVDIL